MKSFLSIPAVLFAFGTLAVSADPVSADQPVEMRSADVSLNHGVVVGTVLNRSALPVGNIRVHLIHRDTVIATAISDENGQFVVKGLRNGGHVLQVGANRQPVRFWSVQSAPPTVSNQMSIVVDEEVVRGQEESGSAANSVLGAIASNPAPLLLMGGAAAATIVVSTQHEASP